MTKKIFRSIVAAAAGVLLASLLILMGCLYNYYSGVQTDQLWEALELAAAGVETGGKEYLEQLDDSACRVTWIAEDGTVLYDGHAEENEMENHADREEVAQALASGKGQSQRYSDTLLQKTTYCAQRLPDGTVLRVSVSSATVGMVALGMLRPICAVLLVSLLLAFFLADRLSERIVEPLNHLDLDRPLENQTYEELAPLLRRISRQHRQIDAQLHQLQQKTDEFDQVTANMGEGLVLLNSGGKILSINPAAKRLFAAESATEGLDFLTVDRSSEMSEAIAHAEKTGHSELSRERAGRALQIDISRIESEGKAIGLVLLVFDVTDHAEAERSRREFTANVSHELKTPLTAILGSSEMIQNGMVKSEDIPGFVDRIHSEANRLLTLIEDILRLSHLDEGVALAGEAVNLASVCEEVAAQLEEQAARSEVTLSVQAEPCVTQGVPHLVQEIVYNLTENAIKYNVPGGSVKLLVTASGTLSVSDTGIGIPPEHQSRVFERFYRVDKSHSKAIGGTGLGLSIVKHAALQLGAEVTLESTPGKGTTVTVQFPKA